MTQPVWPATRKAMRVRGERAARAPAPPPAIATAATIST